MKAENKRVTKLRILVTGCNGERENRLYLADCNSGGGMVEAFYSIKCSQPAVDISSPGEK